MKKIYNGLMLAGALTLCTGCSSSLLDIDNPNEVTNDTYWNKPEDATAGVNACYSFLYKEGTWNLIIFVSDRSQTQEFHLSLQNSQTGKLFRRYRMSHENMQMAEIQLEQSNSHNHTAKSSIFLSGKIP